MITAISITPKINSIFSFFVVFSILNFTIICYNGLYRESYSLSTITIVSLKIKKFIVRVTSLIFKLFFLSIFFLLSFVISLTFNIITYMLYIVNTFFDIFLKFSF